MPFCSKAAPAALGGCGGLGQLWEEDGGGGEGEEEGVYSGTFWFQEVSVAGVYFLLRNCLVPDQLSL